VDRTVKRELGGVEGISGKKSPHVLRHSLATELLNRGADLNAIKELLGHASLAATQVYTHNSIEKLKSVYVNAHPRAKSGGKNGDQS
jgi:integrase/recombinase XerC